MRRARTPLALALAAAATAASAAGPDAPQVKTSLSRTALWTGDRVSYTIEIACPPNVDILQDDLLPERLTLDGLEVAGTERERLAADSGTVTYRVRHQLVTFEIPPKPLRIADQVLRYYVRRPGQRLDDTAPAGETQLPGAVLALRSALPDDPKAVALRDEREAAALPRVLGYLRPLGLGLLVLAAAPAGFWAVALAQRFGARQTRKLAHAREGAALARSALDELRAVDATDDAARRAAYDRLDAALREQLEHAGVPARSCTAAEIAARLPANGRLDGERLNAVLADCERARYAPGELLPGPERFRAGLDALAELRAAR
jgi:hypothetical protein